MFFYRSQLPSDASNVAVSLSMHYGDLDLYIAKGKQPSPASHDCRSADSRDFVNCVVG